MKDQKIDVESADEIVIVIPEGTDEDEIVIDLDELGIDLESLGDDVNIVIQVEGAEDDLILQEDDDDDIMDEPNEWYFDDDAYGIVYYEFPEE